MKRWIVLAASFYPRSWREQFGDEFAVLLDDIRPGWRVFANVLSGALKMQITNGANWMKVAGATAVLGAIVAIGMSFAVAPRYVSAATISVAPQPDPLRPMSTEARQQHAAQRAMDVKDEVLSRGELSAVILKLKLYEDERKRLPLEYVIEHMRRDVRIQTEPRSDNASDPVLLKVSFDHPDRVKAQAAVGEIATRLRGKILESSRTREKAYRSFWLDHASLNHTAPVPPAPVGEMAEVLNPASLPVRSAGPNRVLYLAFGLGAGLLSGFLAAFVICRPRRMLTVCGFAVAGCALAGAASFLIPDRYTSAATMRIVPATVVPNPLDPLASPTPASAYLKRLEPQILSRDSLAAIIQDPKFNLYPGERAKRPIGDVVATMLARDLRIDVVQPDPGTKAVATSFTVSFSYPDAITAQHVVQALLTSFEISETVTARARAKAAQNVTLKEIWEIRGGERLEVLDAPSRPTSPVWPNRPTIAGIGLGFGVLLAAIMLRIRRVRTSALQPA